MKINRWSQRLPFVLNVRNVAYEKRCWFRHSEIRARLGNEEQGVYPHYVRQIENQGTFNRSEEIF